MHNQIRMGTLAIALLGGASLAFAGGTGMKSDAAGTNKSSTQTTGSAIGSANAGPMNLTADQERTIVQSMSGEQAQSAPSGFTAKVGAEVPSSLTLSEPPSTLASSVPAMSDHKVVKLQDKVLVVDENRKVAEIIDMPASGTPGSSTTGSTTGSSAGTSGSGMSGPGTAK